MDRVSVAATIQGTSHRTIIVLKAKLRFKTADLGMRSFIFVAVQCEWISNPKSHALPNTVAARMLKSHYQKNKFL